MTARNLYEAILIELRKENAPNIILEDFNYLANKAINNFINKRYNIYDINQQTTDDLRVLKATAILKTNRINDYDDMSLADGNMAIYETELPSDYLHILNCICIYNVKENYNCYRKNSKFRFAATRLTADMYSLVLDNFWNKPTYKKPYYYIHNVKNSNAGVPTNPYLSDDLNNPSNNTLKFIVFNGDNHLYAYKGGNILYYFNIGNNNYIQYSDKISINNDGLEHSHSAITNDYEIWTLSYKNNNGTLTTIIDGHIESIGEIEGTISNILNDIPTQDESEFDKNLGRTDVTVTDSNTKDYFDNSIVETETEVPTFIKIGDIEKASNIERTAGVRYGNPGTVRLELRCGTDDSVFELIKVIVDYIKVPQYILLTLKLIDTTLDTSQVLEYPDYVCQEIINELVHLIMENISDLRLQTHPVVALSIANPAQALTAETEK